MNYSLYPQIQMILTFLIVAIAAQTNPLEYIFGPNSLHVKVVTAYYFLSIVFLMHLIPYRHRFPWNYLFLLLLTLGSSLTTSTAAVKYEFHIQVKAILSTVVWSVCLSVYAFHTHVDYTVCGTILYYGLCIAFICGMTSLSLFTNTHIFLVYHSCYGILIFAFFFIYDTQIMIGGTHFVRIDPARHNFITLNLYVNIQMMFYYHLILFSYLSGGGIVHSQ